MDLNQINKILQVLTFTGILTFLSWHLERYSNIIFSQKWLIEGINFNVHDIYESNVKGDRTIVLSGFIVDNMYLENTIFKIGLLTGIRNKINEFTIKQIREIERNKTGYPFVIVLNDKKHVYYFEIVRVNLGKRKYLLWRPYEIMLKYMGSRASHKITTHVTLKKLPNDWNI